MAYCAATDVLAYGNFPASDSVTTDSPPVQAVLAPLISGAQAIIEEYTGRVFEYTSTDGAARSYDITDVLDDGMTLMFMDNEIGGAITSIVVGSDTVASSNYTTLPRNDKPIYGIRLKDASTNTWDTYTSDGDWENAIVVTAEWCYSTAAPAEIKHAATRLTYYMYKQRESDADLDRPLLTGDGVTVMPTKLPEDVRSILNRYRRVRVG